MGGLHIEMTMMKLLGDFLEESGWTEALAKADIAQSGTTDAHVGKIRHAYQVTACAFHILLIQAYLADKASVPARQHPNSVIQQLE